MDAMNQFVDTVMSQSNNYDELAQWSFGHYEDAIGNAGTSGQTYAEFQQAYINAYVTDLANVQLNDGQLLVVRALEDIEVARLQQEYREYGQFHNVLELLGVLEQEGGGTFVIEADPNMPRHSTDGMTFSWSADQSFSERFEAFVTAAVAYFFTTQLGRFTTYEQGDPFLDYDAAIQALQSDIPLLLFQIL